MKFFYFIFITILCSIYNQAFAQNLEWAKALSGSSDDIGYSMAVDVSGNVYTAGTYRATADFNPDAGTLNLTSQGGNDIFISKLDASGNFLWARSFGGIDLDVAYGIAVDASGNVYSTGIFSGTADFDPGSATFNLTSAGGEEIFISKLDASGNFVWAKALGGTGNDDGYGLTIDASDNIFITGSFNGIADFDPGTGTYNLSSVNSSDIFVAKLDASGNFVWAKAFGGFGTDKGSSIITDASGNVYTTGNFNGGPVDFDPGPATHNLTSAGSYDAFVSKLDASGNFLWAKSIGGTQLDYGFSIVVDASGNVYTSGQFAATADFNPGAGTYNLTAVGNHDAYISKLNSSGSFVWAKAIGGSGDDAASSIAIDAANNIYTTGQFFGPADFDPGSGIYNLNSGAYGDIFVSELDASGNFVWAGSAGGTFGGYGKSIVLNAQGNIHITGYFKGTVDFDPGTSIFDISAIGISYDVFILKLGMFTSINDKGNNFAELSIIPNPVSNAATIIYSLVKNEKATLQICDLVGKIIKTIQTNEVALKENKIEMDVSFLQSGIFLLKLQIADQFKVQQFVKE